MKRSARALIAATAPNLALAAVLGAVAPLHATAQTPLTGTGTEPVAVLGVSLEGPAQDQPNELTVSPEPTQQLPGYAARRALLNTHPFVPVRIPDVPISQRTVFYDPLALEGNGAQVIVQPREEVPAIPVGVVELASWLVPVGDETDRLGEIVGFAGEQIVRFGRTTVHLSDDVRMQFSVPGSPIAGDEFLVYRVGRRIEGVGDVLVPTGRVRVSHVDELGVVATVVGEYHRIQIGELITRVRNFSLEVGIHPVPIGSGPEATLLAFEEQKELFLPGDFAFIDLGRADGVRIGDEFVGRGEDVMGGERFPTARFQVVGVAESVATVRLRTVRAPGSLRPGLVLILDRMMP